MTAQLDASSPVLAVLADAGVQIARDSITIAVQAATIDTLLVEQSAADVLNALRTHQAGCLPPDRQGNRGHLVIATATLTAVATWLVLR